MVPLAAFQPDGSGNNPPTCSAQIAVTASVQQLTLPATLIKNGSLRLVNSGSQSIAWCYGNSSTLTMANGVVMLGNTVEVFALPAGTTQISVIGAATGSNLIASVGLGT